MRQRGRWQGKKLVWNRFHNFRSRKQCHLDTKKLAWNWFETGFTTLDQETGFTTSDQEISFTTSDQETSFTTSNQETSFIYLIASQTKGCQYCANLSLIKVTWHLLNGLCSNRIQTHDQVVCQSFWRFWRFWHYNILVGR